MASLASTSTSTVTVATGTAAGVLRVKSAGGEAKVGGGKIREVLRLHLPRGLPKTLAELPEAPPRDSSVPHAPKFRVKLNVRETKLALRNALRYFPAELHATLAPEFAKELEEYGHIFMFRFRPVAYEMKAYPVADYPAKCRQAACIMLMIQNNLEWVLVWCRQLAPCVFRVEVASW